MSDKEWKIIKPLLPPEADNQQNSLRQIVDGIFYVNKTGGQWRALPHEYPPWVLIHFLF
jgi:putative transposase